MLTLVLAIKRGIGGQSDVIHLNPRAAIDTISEPSVVGAVGPVGRWADVSVMGAVSCSTKVLLLMSMKEIRLLQNI